MTENLLRSHLSYNNICTFLENIHSSLPQIRPRFSQIIYPRWMDGSFSTAPTRIDATNTQLQTHQHTHVLSWQLTRFYKRVNSNEEWPTKIFFVFSRSRSRKYFWTRRPFKASGLLSVIFECKQFRICWFFCTFR